MKNFIRGTEFQDALLKRKFSDIFMKFPRNKRNVTVEFENIFQKIFEKIAQIYFKF